MCMAGDDSAMATQPIPTCTCGPMREWLGEGSEENRSWDEDERLAGCLVGINN